LGQFPQALAQDGIIPAMRFIGPTSALQANDPAGSASRDAVGIDEILSRVATLHGLQNFF
jgi:hypothetical protein